MHLSSYRCPIPSLGFRSLYSCSTCFPLLAQAEGEEEEEEGEEESSLIEIAEEADLIQADRVIEEEEVVRPRRRKKEENGAIQELAQELLAMRLDNLGPRTSAGQKQAAGEWKVSSLAHGPTATSKVGVGFYSDRCNILCSDQNFSPLFLPTSVALYSFHPHN